MADDSLSVFHRKTGKNRQHLSFPMIPPLKTSLSVNKENNTKLDVNRGNEKPASKVNPLRARSSPSIPLLHQTLAESKCLQQSSPSFSSHNQRSILRYGESAETLFHFDTNDPDQEYVSLCRSLSEGSAADDARVWSRVLDIASRRFSSTQDADLVRLHRRATSRFSETANSKSSDDILKIWLSYATAQLKKRSVEDARLTLRYIKNQGIGGTNALFYATMANVEISTHNFNDAQRILQEGYEKSAPPLHALDKMQNLLRERLSTHQPSTMDPMVQDDQTTRKHGRQAEGSTSPKRRRLEGFTIQPSFGESASSHVTYFPRKVACNTKEQQISLAEQPVKETPPSLLLEPIPALITHEHKRASSGRALISEGERSVMESAEANGKNQSQALGAKSKDAFQTSTPLTIAKSTTARRPPLLSRTPRLKSSGLGNLGKASRVDPNQSMDALSDSDNEKTTSKLKGDSPKVPRTKVAKLDLSYMWNWDPAKSRRPAPGDNGDSSNTSERKHTSNSEEDIPESSATDSRPMESSSIERDNRRRSHAGMDSPKAENCNLESVVDQSRSAARPISEAQSTHNGNCHKSSPPDVNRDFLSLVCERNMIRVNQASYAKLGVIGKGGSCKVYRGLAKDRSVVAIKKVKVGKMDRKTIEGYSNEISLLKRLRGNPSIIQLFDSQVDMKREAIFLVMEPGEADLNHVLQQQSISESKSKSSLRKSLNMNFIRLTWQQMLGAVHSIHEERIIHGDLKPANFLFVRGALKLIDFGIAKAIQSDDTTNIYRENQIGTLNYMSPEALLGNSGDGTSLKIGRASDIWSLGCILYQMVCGRTPFAALAMLQKLQAITNPNYKILYPEDIDPAAEDAIRLCLRRRPEERPPIIGKGGLLNEHRFLH